MDPNSKRPGEEFDATPVEDLDWDGVLDEFEAEDLLGRDIDLEYGDWDSA